jgi:surfactin synthase thioesterase subunit
MRLFCLPHAGSGAAAFYGWKRKLPGTIDVCPVLLPGREARMMERAAENAVLVADHLMGATRDYLDVPYAVFGHSMGSLLAYLWAVRLTEAKMPEPVCLFVSGREGPHVPLRLPELHGLSDEEFLLGLQARFGGAQGDLLQNAELREVFLPILRADLKVVETYRHGPEAVIRCPVMAFAGTDDPNVTDEGLEAWRELTAGEFVARRFPGDHFYHLGDGERELLEVIVGRLG